MLVKLFLNQRINSKGLRLIRLLVLGGLSSLTASIVSSSAYSQQPLIRELEARRYINLINKAQAKYYQSNQHFATQLGQLNIQVPAQTNYYTYVVVPTQLLSGSQQAKAVTAQARPLPNRPYLKAVIGGTLALHTSSTTLTLNSTRCEAVKPPAQGGANGNQTLNFYSSFQGIEILFCPQGYRDLDR